jgi:hypothetical protein
VVEVKINGKPVNREFQNMGQALVFAAASGECVNAGNLVFASAQSAAAKQPGPPAENGKEAPDADGSQA